MTDLQLVAQLLVNAVMSSLILIVIALGVSLFFGLMRMINFAHGELYMLGGYGVWLFSARGLLEVGGPPVLSFLLAMIITMVLVAVLGMLMERFALRPWHGKLLGSFIVSMGFILILQAGALVSFGVIDRRAPDPFPGAVTFAGATISNARLVIIIVCTILIVALYLFIQRTRVGRAMRAVEQDKEAANMQGVHPGHIYSVCMGIGCALAGAAGGLLSIITYINPYVGDLVVMKAFAVVILGGMGSFGGTILGGFVIGSIESTTSTLVGGDIGLMLVFVAVIVTLVFRPRGFLGHA